MTWGCFFATCLPQRQPRRISNLVTPAQPLPRGWVTGGGACDPTRGRRRTFFHLDCQFGDHAVQYVTQSLGSVAPSMFGLLHVPKHGEADVQVVAKSFQGRVRVYS